MKQAELLDDQNSNVSNISSKNQSRTMKECSAEINKLELITTSRYDEDLASSCKPDRGASARTQANQNSTSNQAPNLTLLVQNKQPNKKAQKPRRRVATLAQRRAANIRERRRMFNLNAAFDRLRKKVPSFAYEKRLSRIETLKLAIMYIRFMDDLVNDEAYAKKYKQLTANTPGSSVASGFLSSSSYLSLYGHCESPSPISGVNRAVKTTDDLLQNQTNLTTNEYSTANKMRRDDTRRSLIKIEDIKRHSNGNQIANFRCNENSCLLSQPCLISTTQYRAISGQQQQQQQQASSPVNSAGGCCSSPTSSSLTTCHSTGSTFNESPTSSPLLNSQAAAQPRHLSLPLEQRQQQVSPAPAVYYTTLSQAAEQQQQQQQYHESLQEPQQHHQRIPTAVSSSSTSVYSNSSSDGSLCANGASSKQSAFFYYQGHNHGSSSSEMAELQASSKSMSITSESQNYSSSGHVQSGHLNLSTEYRHNFHQSQHQNHAPPDQVTHLLAYSSSHSLQAR